MPVRDTCHFAPLHCPGEGRGSLRLLEDLIAGVAIFVQDAPMHRLLLLLLLAVLTACSHDGYWTQQVALHDGRVVDARVDARIYWDPVMRVLSQRRSGHASRITYTFSTPSGPVRWEMADAGFGEGKDAFPYLFDLVDGVPHLVVPVPDETFPDDKEVLCARLGFPREGYVVFAHRDGRWRRVDAKAVPPDYLLNVWPGRMAAFHPDAEFQGEATVREMQTEFNVAEREPWRRQTLQEFAQDNRRTHSCGRLAALREEKAGRSSTIADFTPTGPAIPVELEGVEAWRLGQPQMKIADLDARYPGRQRRSGAQAQQDGCDPRIEVGGELAWVDGRRTPTFKRLHLRLTAPDVFPAVTTDLVHTPEPLALRGTACIGDAVYLVLLPWPFTKATHEGRLVVIGRDGALRDLRSIRVPGLSALRRLGEGEPWITPLGLRQDGDDLVLHLADDLDDRGDFASYGIVHAYRLRGALVPRATAVENSADPH
jgi:hypothetical protein